MDPKKAQQQQPPANQKGAPVPAEDHKQDLVNNDGPQYNPLAPLQWKKKLLAFKKLNVIKMSRVLQTVFYLLRYSREEICERDTNKLEWKKAKQLINEDFFKRIGEYNPFGPKTEEYKAYQKLKFLKKNIAAYEPEHVDEYSIALGKLFRWVLQAIELREEDVMIRRDQIHKLKEERQAAIDAAAERERLRENDLLLARAEFDVKEDERLTLLEDEEGDDAQASPQKQRRPFDEDGYLKKWDEDNQTIEIPAEVVDFIDNDFDIEYDDTGATKE